MKIEFIRRGAATRLILIFAGWSTDARYYTDCVADGWDTAVISDYHNFSVPKIPEQYSTIYLFAYSLGVNVASLSGISATARIAICGTPYPVSDEYGIPGNIFKATADGLSERSLMKFHLRMAGDKATFEKIKEKLPYNSDVGALKEELYAIASYGRLDLPCCKWDRAYLASEDRIFPFENQKRYWDSRRETVKVVLHSSHAVSIQKIIMDSLPDPNRIGEGFARAVATYNANAVVQSEICHRIGEKLTSLLDGRDTKIGSLLEIGVGRGLLTDVWSKIVAPEHATFVDLFNMPVFGVAKQEKYVVTDAEEWLMTSSREFDLILSASTIQWFADPVGFINTVHSHLNRGGFAIISTFVKGNLRQLDSVRPSPIIYHTSDEYNSPWVEEMEEWERTLNFNSSREMLMHLKLTGVTPHSKDNKAFGSKHTHLRISTLPTELTYSPIIMVIRRY